jgi:hypothetical protein
MKSLVYFFVFFLFFSCQDEPLTTHKTQSFKILMSEGSYLPFTTHLELTPSRDTLMVARSTNVKIIVKILQDYMKTNKEPEITVDILKNSSLNLTIIQKSKSDSKDIPYIELIDFLKQESFITYEQRSTSDSLNTN